MHFLMWVGATADCPFHYWLGLVNHLGLQDVGIAVFSFQTSIFQKTESTEKITSTKANLHIWEKEMTNYHSYAF